jgi:hypothetical protein
MITVWTVVVTFCDGGVPTIVYEYVPPFVGSVNAEVQYLIVLAVRNPVVPPSVVNFGVPSPLPPGLGAEPPSAADARSATAARIAALPPANKPNLRLNKCPPLFWWYEPFIF